MASHLFRAQFIIDCLLFDTYCEEKNEVTVTDSKNLQICISNIICIHSGECDKGRSGVSGLGGMVSKNSLMFIYVHHWSKSLLGFSLFSLLEMFAKTSCYGPAGLCGAVRLQQPEPPGWWDAYGKYVIRPKAGGWLPFSEMCRVLEETQRICQ